jgi:hypothetical protein
MTPEDAAAAIARPINSFGTRFMFEPQLYADAAEHGFGGLDFYFAGRCGVLGDVGGTVVASALGFFDTDTVRSLWDRGRAAQPPRRSAELFAEACAEWGRANFGDGVDYAELSELAAHVIEHANAAGLPIFAGWRSMPVPDDAVGSAMHRLNVLREFRGGVHLIAVLAAGIDPLHAVLSSGGEGNASLFGYAAPYPDVTGIEPAMTATEELANRLAAAPLRALEPAARERFVELVRATRGALA